MTVSTTPLAAMPKYDSQTKPAHALPRRPILDWSSFSLAHASGTPCIENLPHSAFTTSGRAAIYQALLQLNLPLGSTVLVPSYHCPTMIAPVMLANLRVAYFGIQADGRPNLATIDATTASHSKAMLVSHYFGLAHSLAQVRQWCDEHRIALIEDCAHCYFGEAGERPVGAWGDFSTASLSKFFPVPEGGLLVSAHHPISNLQLAPPGIKAQIKGCIDIFELAATYKRFAGINRALDVLFRFKNRHLAHQISTSDSLQSKTENLINYCDMARIKHSSLWVTTILRIILPRDRIVLLRRRNFAIYAKNLEHLQGAKPLLNLPPHVLSRLSPYVFPLWVNDADRVYHALKALGLPVFRWDKIWPDTPKLNGDVGPLWSQHVLQLLCHQDLSEADIERTSHAILRLLPVRHDSTFVALDSSQ